MQRDARERNSKGKRQPRGTGNMVLASETECDFYVLVGPSPTERMTSDQRFKGGEGLSHVDMWRKHAPDGGVSHCRL